MYLSQLHLPLSQSNNCNIKFREVERRIRKIGEQKCLSLRDYSRTPLVRNDLGFDWPEVTWDLGPLRNTDNNQCS